jgi:hypothetical protein
MAARVFISCGQRGAEKETALKVSSLLRDRFGLDAYLAFRIQSLDDVMIITEQLRRADYYLFIDFYREAQRTDDLACSLFTHQELAVAHNLGYRDIVALKDHRVPLEGFVKYVLSNPATFSSEEELLQKLAALVEERGWSPHFSRNLVVFGLHNSQPDPCSYNDHTGTFNLRTWSVRVENHRPDVAATRTVCILDKIDDGLKILPSTDRSFLKWSGFLHGYKTTLLPDDFGVVNLLSVRKEGRGIFLMSQMDVVPRRPIVENDGNYRLHFKVFSEGFPLLKFGVRFRLHRGKSEVCNWDDSSGELVTLA